MLYEIPPSLLLQDVGRRCCCFAVSHKQDVVFLGSTRNLGSQQQRACNLLSVDRPPGAQTLRLVATASPRLSMHTRCLKKSKLRSQELCYGGTVTRTDAQKTTSAGLFTLGRWRYPTPGSRSLPVRLEADDGRASFFGPSSGNKSERCLLVVRTNTLSVPSPQCQVRHKFRAGQCCSPGGGGTLDIFGVAWEAQVLSGAKGETGKSGLSCSRLEGVRARPGPVDNAMPCQRPGASPVSRQLEVGTLCGCLLFHSCRPAARKKTSVRVLAWLGPL